MPQFMRGLVPREQRNLHRLFAMAPFPRLAAPASYGFLPPTLHMLGNDTWGDCVSAEEFAKLNIYPLMRGLPEIVPTDQECTSWARQHGVLNGADLTQVMDFCARDGITVGGVNYKTGNPQSVDWTNWGVLTGAIFQGPVKIAVSANQLEHAGAGNGNGWVLSGAYRDLNTDHCVGLWGYGTAQQCADIIGKPLPGSVDPKIPSVLLYTWGTVGIVSHPSLVNITDEAYVRMPTVVPDFPPAPSPEPQPVPLPPIPVPTPTPPGPQPIPGTRGMWDAETKQIWPPQGFTVQTHFQANHQIYVYPDRKIVEVPRGYTIGKRAESCPN